MPLAKDAPPCTPDQPCERFFDNFERTTIGTNWLVMSGTWDISGGKLRCTSPTGEIKYVGQTFTQVATTRGFGIEVQVRGPENSEAYLKWRNNVNTIVDDGAHIKFNLVAGELDIRGGAHYCQNYVIPPDVEYYWEYRVNCEDRLLVQDPNYVPGTTGKSTTIVNRRLAMMNGNPGSFNQWSPTIVVENNTDIVTFDNYRITENYDENTPPECENCQACCWPSEYLPQYVDTVIVEWNTFGTGEFSCRSDPALKCPLSEFDAVGSWVCDLQGTIPALSCNLSQVPPEDICLWYRGPINIAQCCEYWHVFISRAAGCFLNVSIGEADYTKSVSCEDWQTWTPTNCSDRPCCQLAGPTGAPWRVRFVPPSLP